MAGVLDALIQGGGIYAGNKVADWWKNSVPGYFGLNNNSSNLTAQNSGGDVVTYDGSGTYDGSLYNGSGTGSSDGTKNNGRTTGLGNYESLPGSTVNKTTGVEEDYYQKLIGAERANKAVADQMDTDVYNNSIDSINKALGIVGKNYNRQLGENSSNTGASSWKALLDRAKNVQSLRNRGARKGIGTEATTQTIGLAENLFDNEYSNLMSNAVENNNLTQSSFENGVLNQEDAWKSANEKFMSSLKYNYDSTNDKINSWLQSIMASYNPGAAPSNSGMPTLADYGLEGVTKVGDLGADATYDGEESQLKNTAWKQYESDMAKWNQLVNEYNSAASTYAGKVNSAGVSGPFDYNSAKSKLSGFTPPPTQNRTYKPIQFRRAKA